MMIKKKKTTANNKSNQHNSNIIIIELNYTAHDDGEACYLRIQRATQARDFFGSFFRMVVLLSTNMMTNNRIRFIV